MKLYEIDQQLESLIDSAISLETGEIINETLYNDILSLQLEKDAKIENLGLWVKNLESDAEQLKAEAKAFSERAKKAQNKADSLRGFLEKYLAGEKYTSTKVAINFRKTKSIECNLDDITSLPAQFLRYGEPTLNKTECKKFIEQGGTLNGIELVEKQSMTIK